MSDVAVIPSSAELDKYADPAMFVELACERAKDWLRQALERGDIEGIVDLKSQAEAIRTYTVQKQLGKDTQLSAAEIVRRAERGIGLAIRKGQAEGEIRKTGQHAGNQHGRSVHSSSSDLPPSPTEFATSAELVGNGAGIYHLTDDVSDAQFETAIDEAREEGNLSRANVVKKVTAAKPQDGPLDMTRLGVEARVAEARAMAAAGHTSSQIALKLGMSPKAMSVFRQRHGVEVPADAVVGRSRLLDSNRIVAGIVESVETFSLLDRIDYAALDMEQIPGWVSSLQEAIRSLTTLKNNLTKESTSRE